MAVLYAVAVWLGRLTTVAGGPSMVWPAAGVSMIWLYPHARRGWRGAGLALVMINVVAATLNFATGAPPRAIAVYCTANTVMAVVSADLLGRGRNRDWAERLDSPGSLYQLLLACLGGGLASGMIGSALFWLVGQGSWMSAVEWTMRNTAGALICGLLWYRIARHGSRVLERPKPYVVAMLALASIASYAFVYVVADDALLFLLVPVSMAPALWADVRTTVWHTVIVSLVVVAGTVTGRGPLLWLEPHIRALIVQTFVIVLAMVAMTIALDREDRRRLERHLEATRLATEQHAALLDRLVNTLSEGVFLVDAEGNVGLGNRLLFQLLGNVDAPQGATLPTQIFDGSYQTPAPVNEALRLGLPASADVTMPGPGDSSRILSVTASPLNSTEGTQVVGVIRDVTEDRRRTQELANFAGVVAHDLRNPLTAVRGWLEVLEDLVEDPATVDIVARIAASESRMNVLIEDLLSYSVVRGGELSPETINLEELFCDIVAAFRDRIIDGRAPTIESDIDAWVRVDRIAMRQVVSNLLGNAMKYAVPGHPPQVTLRLGPVVDGMQHVIVADRGIGLPPGQENKIFQEFHRVAEHRDQCAGTGLGLAICRRVVERHGGRIVATNRPGGGLDIDLAVPATEPTPADAVSFAAWRQARNVRRAAVSLGENPAPTERPART